ncbi:MAG: UDP-N-acetylmuramoyl-tripeptide--D-alanyl-D-alanine ligase [Patescibacteria group bacterium]|nr:UDP-N-acetylmuramoyl-tripeptide--D-alanyl-D-alanine ligase [Patescibacteria group bacterium]
MNLINTQNIIIIISILALIKIARDSLFYLWLWQIKEYRTDRMRAYLRDENAGSIVPLGLWNQNAKRLHRAIATMEPAAVYFIALILILVFYFSQRILVYLTLLFFTFTFYQILKEIKNRILKRPKFTFRILFSLFVIAVFYSVVAFSWIPPEFTSGGMTKIGVVNIWTIEVKAVEIILLLLFFYLVTPILITAIILFTNPFFNFQKKRIIKRASLKMKGLKKIKVIGITGSYGKTSTKEFLNTILSQKYKVVKTAGNNNTNIGVARTVLNKVNDNYDYFICEMGAYKIGEIAEICNIVKPEIGILTGINEQHLDLFGSIENTVKAKFELIEALPENGLAIINSSIKQNLRICHSDRSERGTSERSGGICKHKILAFDKDTLKYTSYLLTDPSAPIVARDDKSSVRVENIKHFSLDNVSDIKVRQDYVEFIYKDQKFKADFLGRHYIENLLAAIITAENLGMSLEEISEAIKKIEPSKFMMRKLDGLNNSIFIDDSYSANPDGVIAGLNYLDEAYQGYRKIIVFPGIIELGNKSEEVHRKLFGGIDKICDIAYIMRIKNQKSKIKNNCKFIFEESFDKVVEMLKNNLNKKTVVLFESRGAGVVMGKLKT